MHLLQPVSLIPHGGTEPALYCCPHGAERPWRTESAPFFDNAGIALRTTEDNDYWDIWPAADNSALGGTRVISFGVCCAIGFTLMLRHDLDNAGETVAVVVKQNGVAIGPVLENVELSPGVAKLNDPGTADNLCETTATYTLDPELGPCGARIDIETTFSCIATSNTSIQLKISDVL